MWGSEEVKKTVLEHSKKSVQGCSRLTAINSWCSIMIN